MVNKPVVPPEIKNIDYNEIRRNEKKNLDHALWVAAKTGDEKLLKQLAEKYKEFNCATAKTPHELVKAVDVVFTVLPMPQHVKAVFEGHGVTFGLKRGGG